MSCFDRLLEVSGNLVNRECTKIIHSYFFSAIWRCFGSYFYSWWL